MIRECCKALPDIHYRIIQVIEIWRAYRMGKMRIIKNGRKNKYVGLLYISPWILGFLMFQAYPFISSFIYSFTDFDMLQKPDFIGIKNYIDMFTNDGNFMMSLKATFTYVIVAVPSKLIFALIIALILNIRLRFINLYRTIYYLPSILGGSVAISILWRFLFMKEGTVNSITSLVHIKPVDWLGSPKIAIYTIGLLAVWQFGSSMVIFLAGLKQIPHEIYEAGRIDGASHIRSFFSITIPFLTPIILFNLVMQTVNAFQEFTAAFVVTNGGPVNSTYLYAMKLYQEGFLFYKMGYASALSWFLFVIIMIFTLVIFKSSKAWVFYVDGGDEK